MVHRRPVYIYFLNVPSFSSRYFNKIKRTSRLGRLLALPLEILSLMASPDMILCNERITKALIRLCGCAGWSAPLLFANHRRQVFSRRVTFYTKFGGNSKLFNC